MSVTKYSVNHHPISIILSWIKAKEIAIPEIQRPFVWSGAKVRDLIDSLYQGYPVGYLIAWQNPAIRLKDGGDSAGKKILIDGQQRLTALMAALLGQEVVNDDYKHARVIIAFHPGEKRFEVSNPAIQKDSAWIPDISLLMKPGVNMFDWVKEYCRLNTGTSEREIFDTLTSVKSIEGNLIGLIELNSELDIETVTDIFIRINSQGAPLSQADFAMSKISANETYGGNTLRKTIDYFCHLAAAPEFYRQIKEADTQFAATPYFAAMSWLKDENDDLYDPSYTDMLRVSFTSEFKRGRLQDLLALLSGRNFESRTYEEPIAESSFKTLESGIMKFMNKTNFQRFIMIVRSAGFVDPSMLRSQNVLNFAYILYLLCVSAKIDAARIESIVRRWLVMSILTGRYSGSPESQFDLDVRRIDEIGIDQYLSGIEESQLSSAFWSAGLLQRFDTSVASSPLFGVYLAAQVKAGGKGFLSRDITVRDLITHKGDIHHLFPKNYLKKNGLPRGQYNQIANYVMMQSEINIAVRDRAPKEYFSEIIENCEKGVSR
ncbi:MAG: DUF262 domain-containing protein, partial [Spirochaetaceae bacterium]|nr:DUF262 domain-containing protein [Spirochaetaceae bacterium]